MRIKTLDQILAEMGESSVSASAAGEKTSKANDKSTGKSVDQFTDDGKLIIEPNWLSTPAAANSPPTNRQTFAKKTEKASSKTPPKHSPRNHTAGNKNHRPAIDDTTDHSVNPADTSPTDSDTATASNANKPRKKCHRRDDTPTVSQVAHLLDNPADSMVIDDKLAAALAGVEIEPIATPDRATRYMRWLAFYYLSNRELSQHQLQQKLFDKDCDPDAVAELLTEFADKGYQSDDRCAYMLIRESVRKGRGKQHIRKALKDARISFDSLDELIAAADIDSISDGTILADTDNGGDTGNGADEVDWLTLAIEARCKKYGNAIPATPKDKAKQLRFLQYRGFDYGVCFDALKYSVDDLPICE